MKVGIVVPVLNNFNGCIAALQSVKTKHTWTPYIIPNWKDNIGVSPAWNRGIKQAILEGADYILVINDDILFSPQTIDALVDHLDKYKNAVMATGANKRHEIEPDAILDYPIVTEESISQGPDFSCFMIRPSTIDEIGWFDEEFAPAYFEDNDYHYRIKLAGKTADATTLAPFYHYGSVTQNSEPLGVVKGPVFERNRDYFASKWGAYPEHEIYKTPYNDPSKTWKDTQND